MESIGIVGLGYVGLPLALQFARSGLRVVGLDVDEAKVKALNAGESYIHHIAAEAIAEQVNADRLRASTDFTAVAELDAIVICVPTPLTRNREPDISYILATGRAIAPHLRRGTLVVLESTTYPGTTDEDLRAVLEEGSWLEEEIAEQAAQEVRFASVGGEQESEGAASEAKEAGRESKGEGSASVGPQGKSEVAQIEANDAGAESKNEEGEPKTAGKGVGAPHSTLSRPNGRRMKAGTDFHLAFSPEREDPGNPDSVVSAIPKVVGGYTPACLARAIELYSRAIKTLVPVSSCRAAEATKLLENIFRSVNIALVNELKLVYGAMGIDVWEVINAAKTKPFGYMPFYPGPGLGGHCIPIDPFYLTWKAREYGKNTRFIELAGEINTSMPLHVVNRVAEALNAQRKAINGSKVLVVGLAYKPNVDDDRESPSYVLMDLLTARGAEVAYYDPHVPVIRPSREHSHWAGTQSIDWNREAVSEFDAVLVSTAHRAVDHAKLAEWSACIIDTRNVLPLSGGGAEGTERRVWKA